MDGLISTILVLVIIILAVGLLKFVFRLFWNRRKENRELEEFRKMRDKK